MGQKVKREQWNWRVNRGRGIKKTHTSASTPAGWEREGEKKNKTNQTNNGNTVWETIDTDTTTGQLIINPWLIPLLFLR